MSSDELTNPLEDERFGQDLAETLRGARERAGLGLREVARQVGVSAAYISQLEHGVAARPTPAVVHLLAKVLHLPKSALLVQAGHLPTAIQRHAARNPVRTSEAMKMVESLMELDGKDWAKVSDLLNQQLSLFDDDAEKPRPGRPRPK